MFDMMLDIYIAKHNFGESCDLLVSFSDYIVSEIKS